jgi:hypothetical protein
MRTAHEAASSALSTSSNKKSPTGTESANVSHQLKARLSEPLLDNFWRKMLALFGHTWASQYGTSPAGIGADTWSAALADVSPAQLANGLRETLAAGTEFPPSAPRFRAMCFGIPSLASVKYLMRAHQFDRFVVLVHSRLDTYVFARADQKTADRLLAEAYEVAKDYVMRGGALPPIPAGQIEHEQEIRQPAQPETAQAAFERIQKLLGEKDEEAAPE